ncbi:CHAT domain-containing protein [[Phormidium] sp. ETS-05]|uniref:CHAT domain-containing protein n=1 Tax=[Phormidium] sp. ETS-05 TaxID=222819 RepID=UPI0018EEF4C6|nr:CHAT domain-containing protein [[Phormidium] sp. ETS-05]
MSAGNFPKNTLKPDSSPDKKTVGGNILAVKLLLTCSILGLSIAALPRAIAVGVNRQESIQHITTEILTASLQQGRELYQSGRLAEAVKIWENTAREYENRGDILNQAMTLNYLGAAYQELGLWDMAGDAIDKSLNLLPQEASNTGSGKLILAQALNNQGSWQLARGQTEAALATWQQAEAVYSSAGNEMGMLGSQINQAQALQSLGQYRRAKTLLEELVAQMQGQPDSVLKAQGLRSLGVALQTSGDLLQSKEILEESWDISKRLGVVDDTSATLLSIGNIARDLRRDEVALSYYKAVEEMAVEPLLKIQAQLNEISLLIGQKPPQEIIQRSAQVQGQLERLSPSRFGVYAWVNLAESMMKLAAQESMQPNTTFDDAARNLAGLVLTTAVQQARELKDARAEAEAMNQLGQLYAQNRQWENAKEVTTRALVIAQGIDADDIVAQAAWQLGQILKQEGDIHGAISAYRDAVASLQSLRRDLVAINRDLQFDFKESVEPVYREFVGLLLQPMAGQNEVTQANLKEARGAIEALQRAEIENFFREACLPSKPVQLEEIDAQAATIHPIILADRLEVILSLPGQPLRHYTTNMSAGEVEAVLTHMYSALHPSYSDEERLSLSQQVYDWLIRPAEAELARASIKTLVFIPDGMLRSLPMAALYDGQQYLVEKYAVALSPGLELFPQGLKRRELQTLAVGLTEARQGFGALPGVEVEVNNIASEVNAKVLLNQEFTRTGFQNQMKAKPFGVVHLATHGQFSSNPEETFLLTWDDKIQVNDFDRLFQNRERGTLNPVELLVLSACETAAGDKRAALGLAGFALRSGARSTLATLWSVNDQSTAELMSEFYSQLSTKTAEMPKAEALRQAQIAMLKNPLYNHPYFWAPFILVGNWL